MICVRYEREQYRLTAKGHACSAPYGTDLVCAAVSMLLHTLERMAWKLECADQAEAFSALYPGDGTVRCVPKAGSEAAVHWVMDTVASGLELLAEDFGDYVSYEEV